MLRRKKIVPKTFLIIYVLILLLNNTIAQTKQQQQIWFGYMTATNIKKKLSIWNDVHYVPNAFFLVRTGLTYHTKYINYTGGYAFGKLAISEANTALKRTEHRPWFQAQASLNLGRQWMFIPRLRYDARFRQTFSNGEATNNFSFIHRIRLMTTLRKFLTQQNTTIGKPFVSISNELLLNAGSAVTFNTFDQNRLSFMLGTQFKSVQVQVGYMNRYVNTGPTTFTQNNTLILWITQTFKIPKHKQSNTHEQDGE